MTSEISDTLEQLSKEIIQYCIDIDFPEKVIEFFKLCNDEDRADIVDTCNNGEDLSHSFFDKCLSHVQELIPERLNNDLVLNAEVAHLTVASILLFDGASKKAS